MTSEEAGGRQKEVLLVVCVTMEVQQVRIQRKIEFNCHTGLV